MNEAKQRANVEKKVAQFKRFDGMNCSKNGWCDANAISDLPAELFPFDCSVNSIVHGKTAIVGKGSKFTHNKRTHTHTAHSYGIRSTEG